MTLTSSWQTIYTPNYPESYPMNARCRWFVHVPETTILAYNIYGAVEGGYDYLSVCLVIIKILNNNKFIRQFDFYENYNSGIIKTISA